MAKRGKSVREILKALDIKVQDIAEEIQKEIDKFRPIIEADIDRVIAKNKDRFNIQIAGGNDLVAELGLGQDGEANEFKINNAWKGLQIKYDSGKLAKATSLTFSKAKKNLGATNINFKTTTAFYKLNLTTYTNEGAAGGTIPWMEWFIEGATTKGYSIKFLRDQRGANTPITENLQNFGATIRNRSRTGEALMFKSKSGPFWRINPRPEIWPHMKKVVQEQMEKSTVKFLKAIAKKFKT